MLGQQGADLVAAEHPPAVRARHGGRAPVAVGVVGDHQVGVLVLGERHRQVHRPRLLRVRERDGREVRIRLLLPRHDVRRLEAGRLEHLRHRGAAHPVQRGVDHREVTRPVAGQPGDGVEVAVDDVLRQDLAGVRAGHVGQAADRGDPLGDLGVGGRHDLAAVAEVDLVAVVLRRVVAGGDHHAGDAAELADREGQERCRQRPGEDQGAQAGAGHHLRGVPREHVGVVAGVVADHHGRAAGRAVLDEVRRETGGGPGHDDAVHPVGSGPERAAQPRRTELERARRTGRRGRRGPHRSRRPPRSPPARSRVTSSGSSAAQARARSRSAATSGVVMGTP